MNFFWNKKTAPAAEFVPVVLPDPIDPNAPRKKILVVEDDAVVAKTLSLTLNARGYDVVCAADSCEAIKLVREQNPDVMLVDVGLQPDLGGAWLCDGFKVAQWLHQTSPKKMPSIIISGSNKASYKSRAVSVGAEAFLAKPLNNTELVQTIKSALENPAPMVKEADPLASLKMAVGSCDE
jgi:CheY-like chemotaxis protein